MTVTMRPGRPDDVDAVLTLWRDADAEPTHTDDAAGLATLLDRDADALILATDDGRLVGSVIAGWDGWRGSIYRIVVAPTHRRQGLGRRLLRAAEDRLASVGGRRSQAIVVEPDAQATGFWRASGWSEQVERLRFVKG
jgi:ribosomal protein S18 acetylase RimI-like enzyme